MLPPLHARDGRGWPPPLKDSPFFINIKCWKSKVVLLIFEQHMGADAFRKVLQQMLQRAKVGPLHMRTFRDYEIESLGRKQWG